MTIRVCWVDVSTGRRCCEVVGSIDEAEAKKNWLLQTGWGREVKVVVVESPTLSTNG